MMIVKPGPARGVEPFTSDEAAAVAALRGCQQGLGGMFPNGTASMYVHPDDADGYRQQRQQINALADALESGALVIRPR